MLIDPKAFKVAKAAGDPLNCLHVEADGSTVATDGHILVKYISKEKPNAKEYPAGLDGVSAVDGKDKLKPFSLSTGSAQAIIKVFPQDKRLPMPILKHVVLDVNRTNLNKHAVLGFTDFKRPTTFHPEKMDQAFPQYMKLFPKGKSRFAVTFGTDILLKTLSVLKSLDVPNFTILFRNPAQAAEIKGTTKDNIGAVLALVMPQRPNTPTEKPGKPFKAKYKPKKKAKNK